MVASIKRIPIMDTNFKITVNLSPEDVVNAIREYIEHSMPGLNVGTVNMNVENMWRGFGPGEHQVATFTGASAECSTDDPPFKVHCDIAAVVKAAVVNGKMD
jgi:hypothetical protein